MESNVANLADAIRKAIEIKGISILQDDLAFCAVIDDIAPSLKKERKLMHRLQQEGVLLKLYDASKMSSLERNTFLCKLDAQMCEQFGFSSEWSSLAIESFCEALEWEKPILYSSKDNMPIIQSHSAPTTPKIQTGPPTQSPIPLTTQSSKKVKKKHHYILPLVVVCIIVLLVLKLMCSPSSGQ